MSGQWRATELMLDDCIRMDGELMRTLEEMMQRVDAALARGGSDAKLLESRQKHERHREELMVMRGKVDELAEEFRRRRDDGEDEAIVCDAVVERLCEMLKNNGRA